MEHMYCQKIHKLSLLNVYDTRLGVFMRFLTDENGDNFFLSTLNVQ